MAISVLLHDSFVRPHNTVFAVLEKNKVEK